MSEAPGIGDHSRSAASVPTSAAAGHGLRVVGVAALASVGILGLLKLPFVERVVLMPVLRMQEGVALWAAGVPQASVAVTLECSGADAVALGLGWMLAFPVRWRRRLAGALGAGLVILVLNIVRLASLERTVGTPGFDLLHVYLWPGALILAVLGYVALWTSRVDRNPGPRGRSLSLPARTGLTAGLLTVAYVVLQPWLAATRPAEACAVGAARIAAGVLTWLGIEAVAMGGVLTTARGVFVVTPDCVLTPLMPVCLALALAWPRTGAARAGLTLALAPLFGILTVLRLLTVALPPALTGAPAALTHAFYQLLVALVLVTLVAVRRGHASWGAMPRRVALAAGLLAALAVVGGPYTRGMFAAIQALGTYPVMDEQGALRFLPAFQLGFLIVLWLSSAEDGRWPQFGLGLVLLAASQVGLFLGLGWLHRGLGVSPSVTAIRGVALAGPLLIAVTLRSGSARWLPGARRLHAVAHP